MSTTKDLSIDSLWISFFLSKIPILLLSLKSSINSFWWALLIDMPCPIFLHMSIITGTSTTKIWQSYQNCWSWYQWLRLFHTKCEVIVNDGTILHLALVYVTVGDVEEKANEAIDWKRLLCWLHTKASCRACSHIWWCHLNSDGSAV